MPPLTGHNGADYSNEFSEDALFLLDRYRVDNANDPITIFVSIFDKMSVHQREVISRFEAAIALAGVEFGRIDLAIEKAEEMQRQVECLNERARSDAEKFHVDHGQNPSTKQSRHHAQSFEALYLRDFRGNSDIISRFHWISPENYLIRQTPAASRNSTSFSGVC